MPWRCLTALDEKTLAMKYLACVLMVCSGVACCCGQVVNYDLVVPSSQMRPRTFEDYLVQLAWQNTAANRVKELRKQVKEEEVMKARRSWTREVRAGFNLNEVSLANLLEGPGAQPNDIVIYPLYQFSVTVPLSTFVLAPHERAIAELEVKAAQAEIDQQKLAIRAEVLRRYHRYLSALEVLESRALAEADAEATYKLVQRMFENRTGEVQYEDMNAASSHYYSAREARVKAETEVKLARIDLEEMIGISWEMAERWKARLDR